MTQSSLIIRPAGPDDIPLLVRHHHKMFAEIVAAQKSFPENAAIEEIDSIYRHKLMKDLGRQCHAWIAETNDKIIAGGALSLLCMVPVPGDPSCTVAYIHSIYTEVPYRKKGAASKIVETAIDYCRSQNIHRIILNTSHAGAFIYKKLGFTLSENHMRLWLP